MIRTIGQLAFVTFATLGIGACGAGINVGGDGDGDRDPNYTDDDNDNDDEDAGTLTIIMQTDDQADVRKLSVDVAAVWAHQLEDADGANTDEWIELDNHTDELLIIDEDGSEQELVSDELEAGLYDEVEIEADGVEYLNEDGDWIDIDLPGFLPDGSLYVEYEFDVEQNQETELVADPSAQVTGSEEEGYGFDIDIAVEER